MGPRAPSNLLQVIEKGRRKKLVVRLAATAGVVCVVAGSTLAPRLAGFTPNLQPDTTRPDQAEAQASRKGCPASRGKGFDHTRWTSPTTHIAEGSFGGGAWGLCARTVENTETSEDGLCMSWRSGDTLGSGMNCIFTTSKAGEPVALDEDYFSPVMGPAEGVLYGAAPAESASVELAKHDGTIILGQIYPAPKELRVPFSFFTIFDEPYYTDGELIVRDGSGTILVRQTLRLPSDPRE